MHWLCTIDDNLAPLHPGYRATDNTCAFGHHPNCGGSADPSLAVARAYADNTERLATAFDSLYASLTDTQKQAADTLFRQQATAASQPRTRR